MSISLSPLSPTPAAMQAVEEQIDWEDPNSGDESLDDLSEEELMALLHTHASSKTTSTDEYTTGIYKYFMDQLALSASEREAIALLFMREVEASNAKLDEYNKVLALLQSKIEKDGDEVDLHSVMLPDGQSIHEWFLENEPDIYKGSKTDAMLTQDELSAQVNAMQSQIETIGTTTQIYMLQIQDELGKSDALTSGMKTVLDGFTKVLSSIVNSL